MDAKVGKNMPGPHNGALDPRSRTARLGDLSRRVPPPSIGDIWLFPPLPQLEDSSEFLLFTRILEDGKRALYSARMVPANGTSAHQVVVEHGRAPADRVPSLVARLQRRLRQPTPARHVSIDGDDERWETFLEQYRETDAAD
ncbi:hypothetical protein [Candidatus Palauibacter sp.]|uniref:hypothetical protein n=1 Tax=Candidatus Palauibacter sp. TaxID=3101350 RepID=UPI003B019B6B